MPKRQAKCLLEVPLRTAYTLSIIMSILKMKMGIHGQQIKGLIRKMSTFLKKKRKDKRV